MKTYQKELVLKPHPRGYHLITKQILEQVPEIKEINIGWMQLFIKHTSASLTINENADPSVRTDFESHMNKLVPEDAPYYIHTYEGSDDMPAHIKASLMGASVQVPISNGCATALPILVNLELNLALRKVVPFLQVREE